MSKRLKQIGQWLQVIFILLAVTGCIYYVRLHWADILTVLQSVSPAIFLAATLVSMSGYVIRGMIWSVLLRAITGTHLGFFQAFRISSISWMGRYLPGKIWALAGKACLSAESPEHIPATSVAVVVDTIWFELSGLFLALLCGLASLQLDGAFKGYFAAAAIALPVGLLVCHPRVYCPIANYFLRMIGKPTLSRHPSTLLMGLLLLMNSLTYILRSWGLLILMSPHTILSGADFLVLVMTLSLAWVLGFIVLFAPAGIGVRDTVLAMGLSVLIGLEPGTVVFAVLGSRVLSTASELLCFLIASLIPSRRQPQADCANTMQDKIL